MSLPPGSTVAVTVTDSRWWVRLWCALLSKPLPTRESRCRVDLI